MLRKRERLNAFSGQQSREHCWKLDLLVSIFKHFLTRWRNESRYWTILREKNILNSCARNASRKQSWKYCVRLKILQFVAVMFVDVEETETWNWRKLKTDELERRLTANIVLLVIEVMMYVERAKFIQETSKEIIEKPWKRIRWIKSLWSVI